MPGFIRNGGRQQPDASRHAANDNRTRTFMISTFTAQRIARHPPHNVWVSFGCEDGEALAIIPVSKGILPNCLASRPVPEPGCCVCAGIVPEAIFAHEKREPSHPWLCSLLVSASCKSVHLVDPTAGQYGEPKTV